jgi:hypothetical protein
MQQRQRVDDRGVEELGELLCGSGASLPQAHQSALGAAREGTRPRPLALNPPGAGRACPTG